MELQNALPARRDGAFRGLVLAFLVSLGAIQATPGWAQKTEAGATLRVGTSGDYAPFSFTNGEASPEWEPRGFDIEVARAYAKDRGLQVEWVPFRWPELLRDLESKKFDIAMSGITVRPERSLAGRYTLPVASSGAVVLLPGSSTVRQVADLDDPAFRIAVNRGGHLERVTRRQFSRAQVISVPDNHAVLGTLIDGKVDAVVTDTLEAPRWQARHPGTRALGPFTRDTKAYLVASDHAELARDLDGWLLEREADGTLDALRQGSMGVSMSPPPADVLVALLAAIDERLALMPLVAESKRQSGRAVEDREREATVIDRATSATRNTRAPGILLQPINEDALRALFRSQIEAAKEIQRATLAQAPDVPASADLETELRPALGRIGDRISWLVVQLPTGLSPQRVRNQALTALSRHALSKERILQIADSIVAIHTATSARNGGPLPQGAEARGTAATQEPSQ